MAEEIVRVELEPSYPYKDFEGWFNSLADFEQDLWVQLAKSPVNSENNKTLLTKKAIELYCLEMDIDYIPKSEEYLETIYRRLITNLVLISLLNKELIEITEGKFSFLSEPKFKVTEKGENYRKKPE